MKSLSIDSAITKISISARNEDHTVSAIFNIGMKQSETLLPAIEYVLSKVELKPTELEALSITQGPGSFTGLRLGFSALKSIQLSSGAPLYGFSTLDVYAAPYKDLDCPVISCIDAKKDRFYAKGIKSEEEIFNEGDYTPEEIRNFIKDIKEEMIVICGSDAELLADHLKDLPKKIIPMRFTLDAGEILNDMLENAVKNNAKAMNDYDGPIYLRASEAEVKLSQ